MPPQEEFLLNWSPEKAWWLGVIYGDGNVYEKIGKLYRVSVVGSPSTVTRWLAVLDPSRQPHRIKHSPGTKQGYIDSVDLVAWFKTRGICGPKAGSLVWPGDLPADLFRSFLQGLWDTDGSLSIWDRRAHGKKGNPECKASYTSKCKAFVYQVRDVVTRVTGAPVVAVVFSRKRKKRGQGWSYWWTISYGGSSAMLVADYLYPSAPEHLRNEDRMDVYRQMVLLRDQLTDTMCACGLPVQKEGRCTACWWAAREYRTGLTTVCSTEGCGRPVLAKGKCSACYTKLRRSDPEHQRKPTGTCTCGNPAYRCGKCDACYSRTRRAEQRASG